LLWGFLLSALAAGAQAPEQEFADDSLEVDIESRMMEYVDNLTQLNILSDMQIRFSDAIPLTTLYAQVLSDKVAKLNNSYESLSMQWTVFTQAMQAVIADSEDLMTLMTRVEQLKKVVADSIASKQQQCNALADFAKAEEFILGKDTTYASLYKKAYKLSLIQKLTPKLEKVKANEMTLFAQIQEHYGKAQKANELLPILSKRMETLSEQYANIQVMSKKIQELTYMPLIQRLKDYLISFACVAVLLLFFNMAITRYKTLKAARQQMKKYESMMRQGGGASDYPTI
jgi:hypothetical protein